MSATATRTFKITVYAVCFLFAASVASAFGAADLKAPDRKPAQSESSADTASGNAGDVSELRRQMAEQQKQIEELRLQLQEQANLIANLGTKSQSATAEPSPSHTDGGPPSMTPPITAATAPPARPQLQSKEESPEVSPLQFRIGSAYFTPVGFMDFTAVFRDTAPGSGIGTNFGSIPYRTSGNVQGNLSEFRFSPQNSRLGMRIDTRAKGATILAYWESDFLGGVGNPPVGNVTVSSNSYPFRLRLYWVDVRMGKFEFLGGQTWNLTTPGRNGISPLPGDLFYTQDVDVNYQLGLVWGRIPEFRMVYHPSNTVAMAFALDSPEQYIGGSGGGGQIVLPANLATPYTGQLNNGSTTLSVPNVHPDIIVKFAFDPTLPNGHAFHFEFGGFERTFKTYNPLTNQNFTSTGWGSQANLNIELLKGFRFVTNNFWGHGGGRYIFGQAPDVVVRNDGSLSPVRSGSTLSGFEYTHKNFLVYSYYGGVYIQRNVVYAPNNAPNNGSFVGYGFSGGANSQNRSVQEGTFGFTNTFWKDAKYGALSLMGQYSYYTRNPWFVATGAPTGTHMNEVFLNLRYSLPGSAPVPR